MTSTDRVAAAGAALLALVALGSLALRVPDPPIVPPPPTPPPVAPLPHRPPVRPLPPLRTWDPAAAVSVTEGVEIVDVAEGTGDTLFAGHVAVLEFAAWSADGTLVEATAEHAGPVRWPVGFGLLPDGLEVGLEGLAVGGERTILVAPDQGWGGEGVAGRIPAGQWLQYDVTLVDLIVAPERAPDPAEARAGQGAPWEPGHPAVLDYAVWSSADPSLPLDSSYSRWYPLVVKPGAPLPPLFVSALTGARAGARVIVEGAVEDAFGAEGRPPLAPPGTRVVLRVDLRSAE